MTQPRRPLLAALLSFAAPGLGQVYCGAIAAGLVLQFFHLLLASLAILAALQPTFGLRLLALAAALATGLLWLYAVLDARSRARAAGAEYTLKDYNRWFVYLALFLLPLPLSVGWLRSIQSDLLQAFRIASHSMAPSLEPGDLVLSNKLAYRLEPVRRGDVIIFPHPDKPFQSHVKRVVGLPGDTLECSGEELRINGRAPQRSPVGADPTLVWEDWGETRYQIELEACDSSGPTLRVVVPHGTVFVLGDGRNNSFDSRHYGSVSIATINGRVDQRVWPRWESLQPARE